ncbi:DNA gyrase subunit B [Candidatus Pacearchaeota archaeon CG1_02_30_18]|nr:DNA topoisomerase (ATP-hydrolyzing) subunit B [Candidatus Pacearchaeota archaeon]OIO40949.1 MAG: DNA gyrase subunit B [Candidatus Pacearchaeota archaeon CG1_02_30_18]PIN71718.1 MAG: DNA topoisomerase (ATP-hydrolyzing) subunit B [Candidatus Pacearchaeota archaeon CG11_big_fil_rev_8_21_14_0_20_30_13]PIZ81817.1 MAG: DNA topoisomerase (ATP-hydrolyzing) subunit B [Candidatus Pacearchaeota archaeon CG_4_10_14_0_2_um_filter_30_11]PJA71167.1 MAG: DNA topoisomerase (ATP-hydrolyzing) subunit B [Candid
MAESADQKKYGAENIRVLEGLEGVRKRPAMYIGGTDKQGLHHLVYELLDNSVDEALAGYCSIIKVIIHKDGSCSVEDDGRGIPTEIHSIYKVPAVEVALTKLHAGGKFDKDSYKVSGGLHGVGVSCVNALAEKLFIRIKRDGKIYEQEYSRGLPQTKLKVVGKCGEKESGTFVKFFPDPQIFSTLVFDYKILETRFREVAFLNAGLKILLEDEIRGKSEEFHAEGGVMEFVRWINKSKEVLHPKPIYFKKEIDNMSLEIGIQYTTSYQENIFGFVNTINTIEGGTHVSGLKTALTRVINDYVKKKNLLKNGDTLMGDDVREGITAIISIKIPDPQFEGQTKSKLGNSEVKGYVDSAVTLSLSEFLEENPSVAKVILQKILDSAKARLAAKKAKDLVRRKNLFSLGGLPGKLADCSSKKSEDSELYLVEGESAGGSAKNARSKETQAILGLKGKILNVEKANISRVLSSEEITNMITAIGAGVGEEFDLSKLRYKRIIIMTDADVDGEHIKTLLLTFFFRFMPNLIENGHIYIAMPPLFRIRKKKDHYVYSEDELKKETAGIENSNITRFKGLGEMSSEQLWDTTMNPKTRKIKKVFIEDAVEADQVFSMLMGDDVQGRKDFIAENAHEAALDI